MIEIFDDQTIGIKITKVHDMVRGKKVIVAFSGGVDSSVLASLVADVAQKVLLVMQLGAAVGIGEKEFAVKEAEKLGIELIFIEYDEYLESPEYRSNPENRCYYCKSLLHSKLEQYRQSIQFDLVVNGTNSSDLGGHRPGYKAVLENSAISPLALAGLSKPEIRTIASERGLKSSNKPATPCIASRIKTGVHISKEILEEIKIGENLLKKEFNLRILRLRHDGEYFTLELGKDEYKGRSHISQYQKILDKAGIRRKIRDIRAYKPYVPIR